MPWRVSLLVQSGTRDGMRMLKNRKRLIMLDDALRWLYQDLLKLFSAPTIGDDVLAGS